MAEQKQNNVELTDEEKAKRARKRTRTIIAVVSVAVAVLIAAIVLLLLLVKCEPEENVDPPVGHTHTYSSWVVVDEPTCTEEGLRERTCSCGEKETEMIEALGHAERAPVRENEKAPTCTAAGSYEEVVCCTVCEEELSRKTVTVDALRHTEGRPVVENATEGICTVPGSYEEVVYCTVCGEELSRKTVTGQAAGHDYHGVLTTEPLCTTEGEMTYTCTRCVDSYKETIAPLGHDWGEMQPGTAATCTEKGYSDHRVCSRCGIDDGNTIPAKGHAFIGNTCDACGYTYYSEGLDYKVNGDTVTIIGKGDCSDTTIYIPAVIKDKPVTEIGNNAFYECTSLTEIDIPDSVTLIGEEAFFGCKSLTSIEIPDSVTSIGERAFMNCEALTDVALPDGITSIEDYMFYRCSALKSVELPNSITSIGKCAFSGCSTLKSVKLPDGITSFSTEMFSFCTSLEEITISNNVTEIGRYCFYKCENLKSVKFDDSTSTWNILRIVSTSKNEYLTDFTPTNDTAANAKALTDTYSNNIWTKQTD